ncbi:MAG: glycosyltransferase [Cyanobacteria bacterium P01_D01_bin.123]
MKVLFVTPSLGPVFGGPTKAVLELVQALVRTGTTVDIVTTTANGCDDLDVPTQTWIETDCYRAIYFPRWKWKDYTMSWSLTQWLFQHVRNYDLVHVHSVFSYPVLPAHWACQRDCVPTIRTPHGMLEPWALSYKAWKKRYYYQLLEAPLLQRACAIHALAEPEATNIQSLNLRSPVTVIPNGIHREEFETLPDAELFFERFPTARDRTVILFLGRIDPKKGLDILAPAFARARQRCENAYLVVAGPDNTRFMPQARQFFLDADCLDAVAFTGMLTGELKLAALAAADLYVAPYYSEGFSMSVLEGMASRLPCVITTGCNFPQAARAEAACVVEPDVEAFTVALLQCLDDRARARAMGDRAREFVFAHYTWNTIAAQMRALYDQILVNAVTAPPG